MTSPIRSPLIFANGHSACNRMWLAPMTNQQSHDDGSLSVDELEWLRARAAGGFGVVETCATHVSRDGQGWTGELGIFDDALIPGWEELASAIRKEGALLIAQLFHGGERSPRSLTGVQPWSASEREAPDGDRAREATHDDIARIVSDFRDAALRAHRAGADGVELHGANGYLICQFLSSEINRREDEYGGAIDGRARLVREIFQAVRAAVPPDFIVGVRLSPESRGRMEGLDIDETIQAAKWLCDDGADFIHLSLWSGRALSSKYPESYIVSLVREGLPSRVPLITSGGVWTLEEAEAELDLGADAIALGRAAITNPDWPRRCDEEGWSPLRPPVSRQQLRERALGERFIEYMTRWPDFVLDEPTSNEM